MANTQTRDQRCKKILKKAQQQHQAGKLGDAHAFYLKLLELKPDDGETYYCLGRVLKDSNHLQEAVPYFEKAITLGVRSAEIFAELAHTMVELSRFHDAMPMAKAAVTLNPDNPQALRSLMLTLFALGQYEQARVCGERLVSKSPGNAENHILLAKINADSNHHMDAIEHANKALSLDPDVKNANQVLCATYTTIQRWDEAMEIANHALEIEPGNPSFTVMKATILERQGLFKDAYALIKPLVKNNQTINDGAIHLYAKLAKRFNKQHDAVKLLERLQSVEQLPVSILNITSSLLGTAYDDLGQYDKAFTAIDKANTIKPHRYNDQNHEIHIRAIMEWFTKERLQHSPVATHGSKRPIFIVGMPRSGTSLTEKIVARHPDVFGGGELKHMDYIVKNELPKILNTNKLFPDYLQDLSTDSANQAAEFYLDHIDQLAPNNETHVTDKMPMNFTYLGLIALLFPQARIIHCTRNPLDTGLSCYFINFTNVDHMGFTQDLKTIGHYYKRYEKLMEHWHQILPNPIYDLSYEELVKNPDTEIRKLLKFCELPWHEDCLNPHRSKEATKTASYNQVRRPINTRSIERWKHYEKHLQPLKEALGLT